MVCARWCPTLPHPGGCSTIGAGSLSFRVRNGAGRWLSRCDHRDVYGVVCACCVPPGGTRVCVCVCVGGGLVLRTAWWTRACLSLFVWLCVVCVGQLVPVGLQALAGLPRPAYLPSGLLGAFHHPGVVWIPYLEAGFPLRCFQRLPFPNVANQPCPGRDNWHTRGSSVPVLSYWGRVSSSLLRAQRIGTELSHDVLNPARVPL